MMCRQEMPAADPQAASDRTGAAESTVALLERARSGDTDAAEALFLRCLPALRRFARSKLPQHARDLLDTQDLVQDALLRVIRHLHTFEWRGEGSLMAYLRTALLNRVLDEQRRAARRPSREPLDDQHADRGASPLETVIGRENHALYERALHQLPPAYREAIVLRFEMQYSFDQIADALDKRNPANARMFVSRATMRLGREIAGLRRAHAGTASNSEAARA
jgi:RNA polymerase sigma-70 factor (ECF subfamily)